MLHIFRFFGIALLVFSSIAASAGSEAQVSGTVSLGKAVGTLDSSKGVLYVLAKKSTAPNTPPMAVLRIVGPQFPVKFSLSQANAMMPGTVFEGPMIVIARYSQSGDALDKSGPEGSKESVKLGESNLAIELKNKK